jgi:hypothetical protein
MSKKKIFHFILQGSMSRKVELWSGGTTYQVENAALDEIEMVNTWRSHPWKDDQERGLVTQLVLDNNKLCVLPKECIDWFPGLKYLWLQRNRIEIWPEAITRLVSLEQL